MLFPERRFGLVNNSNNLFDYLFSDPIFNVNTSNRMSTDIKEKDNGYELAMEVPGFDKEDLKLELEKGYLTIMAEHKNSSEKKDEDGHPLVFVERFAGYSNTPSKMYCGKVKNIYKLFRCVEKFDSKDVRTFDFQSNIVELEDMDVNAFMNNEK